MDQKDKVAYKKKDIIEALKGIEQFIYISDTIGSSDILDKSFNDEDIVRQALIFDLALTETAMIKSLARSRTILSSAFSDEVGEDEMDELEREFEKLNYLKIPFDITKDEAIKRIRQYLKS